MKRLGQEERFESLAVELGRSRVREVRESSGRLPPKAKYWFPSDGIVAASALRFPVLFMLGFGTFPERFIWDAAQRVFKLPPKRKEERELLKLEVLELLVREVGASIRALMG